MEQYLIEALESRLMFAVKYTFIQGELEINGSSGPDQIEVSVIGNPSSHTMTAKITVDTGEGLATRKFSKVINFTLNGNDGDDILLIHGVKLSGFMQFPRTNNVHGGNGDDNIVVSHYDGSIIAYGDAGNDIINASRALSLLDLAARSNWANVLNGGNGNDTLIGSSDGDYLSGGYGNDVIRGSKGDDIISGGPGINILSGGAGKNIINDD